MPQTKSVLSMDRFLDWSLQYTISPLGRFLIVSVAVVIVGVFRSLFVTSLLPWLFFIPVIVLCGLVLGRGAGLYASALSTLVAAITIMDRAAPFLLSGPQWAGSFLFLVVTAGLAWLAAELRYAFARYRKLAEQHAEMNEDLRQAETQQHLLNEELSHRLKNVLAVVQSVVSQTLRQATDLNAANSALSARLVALGNATTVLTASSWASADMIAMIEKVLGPHSDIGKRIRVDGPAMTLNSKGALAFALALHELATNAAKYGALSNEDGRIELTWSIEPVDEVPRLYLRWQEIGGPPVVAPTRRGFGSTMIERSLKSYFRGDAKMQYHPTGLIFEIDCDLEAAGMVEN
ncbi:HWE histidine kinase domain-containing protein [Neorhizobium sp. NPDC001467]|uniref:HWE histidine kinase domain-containing protein n=1 Tax=Neorhizobium sp. NPDC001467 TaxID=3390595 RepID=UPI003D0061B1